MWRFLFDHIAMFLVLANLGVCVAAEHEHEYTFGTTVVSMSALQGRISFLKGKTVKLQRLEKMKAAGIIYTKRLNVWPQDFDQGFPGITDRFEWFGIDYTGRFWIEKSG